LEHSTLGRHVIVDAWGIDASVLDDLVTLSREMYIAAEQCGATVVGCVHRKFEPHGVTIALLLSESHLTLHSYPEHGYAAIDCYTCGETADPSVAVDYLLDVLRPTHYDIANIQRGTTISKG
jgi:S-adenosylmethionine decarboxylase